MAELRAANIEKVTLGGTATGAHSYSHEEAEAFTAFINNNLAGDEELTSHLPISPENGQLFEAVRDGILMAKLINDAVPQTIDERALNRPKNGKALNAWQISENQNIVIGSARAIGCRVINVSAEDLALGTPHLVLGLVWQVVRIGCLSTITLADHPELYRLLEDGEDLADFIKLPPEDILLRWFNYHLKAANWPRRVTNFSGDLKDAENYTALLAQIAPEHCNRGPLQLDAEERADKVIKGAAKLGVEPFLKPRDITSGSHKLNLAFVAELFNAWPALAPLDESEQKELLDAADFDDPTLGREERAFRNWINNLPITDEEGNPVVIDSLFEDLRDGVNMLRIIEKIEPGLVDWKKVSQGKKLNAYSKVGNCNYSLELAKKLRATIIGIDGKNISDANPRGYTLAVIWQLQRYDLLNSLKKLSAESGADVTEDDVVQWANGLATKSGCPFTVKDFKAKRMFANSRWILSVIAAIEPRAVDWEAVTFPEETTKEDNIANARYALTAARRIGATPYAIAEDLVEGNAKLLLQMVVSLKLAAAKWNQ